MRSNYIVSYEMGESIEDAPVLLNWTMIKN